MTTSRWLVESMGQFDLYSTKVVTVRALREALAELKFLSGNEKIDFDSDGTVMIMVKND